MSKDANKSEPSMEDILASIRRIIDEDGGKARKAPPPGSSGKAGSDILELTELVNDDGSVTSLDKQAAAGAGDVGRPLDEDEPPIYADREERERPPPGFIPPETIRPNLAGDPRPQPAAPPPVSPPVPPSPPPFAPPAAPAVERDPPPAAPPRRPATASVTVSAGQPSPRISPSLGGGISLTPVNAPPASSSASSSLVSNQTANATTAAFDRLAQAALQQPAPAAAAAPKTPSPTVGGRALEDMVAEMLRPMLKQWLDANLPGIVERLVQQEIQKMTKR